jgi:hypothetical protein
MLTRTPASDRPPPCYWRRRLVAAPGAEDREAGWERIELLERPGPWVEAPREIKGVQLRDVVIGAAEWPDHTYFAVCEGSHAGLARRMKKVSGARLIGASASSAASSPVDQTRIEALREELVRRRGRRRRSTVARYAGLVAAALLIAWLIEWRRP